MFTHTRCIEALSEKLARVRPEACRVEGYRGYTVRIEDNLVAGADPESFLEDYGSGAGQELCWSVRNDGQRVPPKMHATYSSSALVVNTFSQWRREPASLELLGIRGFDALRFEAQCPTGLKGIPPHLDVLCTSSVDTVGIESKCLEYLQPHRAHFPESYDALHSLAEARPYFDLISSLRMDPGQFVYLDAAQLIKHALGLANCFPGRRVKLFYLFWEPSDGREYSEFRLHRLEARRFADAVSGAGVEFNFASYPELWASWRMAAIPERLQRHMQALAERYNVSLGEDREE